MDEDWNDNYGPGGHAEQVRNGLWGKTEPTAAPLGWFNGTAAPLIWFNGTAFLYGNYVQQLPQRPNGSVEPGSELTEIDPPEIEPTGPEPMESEPTDSEPVELEPTELEPLKPESSSLPESPAEESEEASSSSDSEQRKKPIRKRHSRKQTPAMRREVAANVPKRSKTKSMNPAENGVDDKIKGQIRHDPSEGLQQRETEHDEWKNAVYHEAIRSQLFDQAGPINQYMETRKSGPGDHNTTAFCEAQRNWCLERNQWYLIQDNILNRLERKEYGSNQPAVLGPMMWDNRVVIDHDNHIVIDYDIPVTLSTEYEGQHMETCRRLMPGLMTRDFWARMPRLSVLPKAQNIDGVLTKTGKLSNRQDHFRRNNGLLSWKNRQGTSTMRDLLIGQLSEQQKMDNTTEGFTGLSKEQLKFLAAKSKDSPSSVGKRKYHEDRKRREAKDQKDDGKGSDDEADDSSPVQKKVRRRRKGPSSDA